MGNENRSPPSPTSSSTSTSIQPTVHHQQQHPTPSSSSSSGQVNVLNEEKNPTRNSKELKLKNILRRVVFGLCMFSAFSIIIYCGGHVYICTLIIIIELLLFNELVRVRYSSYYDKISNNTIPLFRTIQWLWFAVAISYTYSDFICDIVQSNNNLHYMMHYTYYISTLSFVLYSCTFILSIITLQRDHIKFQINQLCWTILVLCLTVGQLRYIMHNIFNGLIWFVLPCCLVFTNDSCAYISGILCGRKFISYPFLSIISPNKTWEGFIGGWICTMIVSWYLSKGLAQYTYMTCPMNEFRFSFSFLEPKILNCDIDPIFLKAQSYIPSQMFELIPVRVVKFLFPNILEICSIKSTTGNLNIAEELVLTPCISGENSHIHHHFEYWITDYYPIQMHALWLGMFASFVAPFGGYFASAIKRAYGIKDFDSLIPGHGGVMDRMDCQFLMALYTWVHYNSFVKFSTISVPKLLYMYSLLSDQQKDDFLRTIMNVTTKFTTDYDHSNISISLLSSSTESMISIGIDGTEEL